MTLKEIFSNLEEANFDLLIQVCLDNNDITLYEGNAYEIEEEDFEILDWNINYMWANDKKQIVFELDFEGEKDKIDTYKIEFED